MFISALKNFTNDHDRPMNSGRGLSESTSAIEITTVSVFFPVAVRRLRTAVLSKSHIVLNLLQIGAKALGLTSTRPSRLGRYSRFRANRVCFASPFESEWRTDPVYNRLRLSSALSLNVHSCTGI
jgi:hypothetical protein